MSLLKTTLLFLSIFLFSFLHAQDIKAKEILDKVSSKNKAYKTIEAEFNFKRENLQDKSTNSSKGKVWIKGNMYKLDLMGTESYYNGKTNWSFIKDANEVNISDPDPKEDGAINPAKLFSIYESGFKYKFISEKFEHSLALYEIELYPVDIKKEFTKMILQIDKDKMQIYSFRRYDKNGTHYTIEITKTSYNTELGDSFFIYDPKAHPKAQVNDMR